MPKRTRWGPRRLVRCLQCGREWVTTSARPRCGVCWSMRVEELHAAAPGTKSDVSIERTQREMVARVLPDYLAARAERLAAERREKAAAELLRSWLRANGEDELVDAESGWGVRLQTAQGTPRYDVVSLREHDPALWQRCVELALVTLDHRAVQAQERAGQIAGLDRYRMPGPTTERLVVVEAGR